MLLNINSWPWYKKLDVALLRKINVSWSNPLFDTVLPWMRESMFWLPFYLFLLVFAVMNLGKKSWYWIMGLILTVTVADQTSSNFIKKTVARVRPCRDPDVLPLINLRLDNCSGAYSFTSSHATNHFAVSLFIIITLYPLVGKKLYWLLLWAAVVSYAQMYVGVHYPIDILGGMVLGVTIGFASGKLFNHMVGTTAQPLTKV